MNKKLLALAVAGALAAPLSAQAVDFSVNGSLGWKMVSQKDHDLVFKATKVRLGWMAVDETSVGKFIADVEFDFDDYIHTASGSPIDARKARMIWVTKGAGTVVMAARTPSGNYDDMVAGVDIFNVGQNIMFSQPSHVGNVLAWKSPTSGGIYGVIALVAATDPATGGAYTKTAGGKSPDATVWRLVYNGGGLHVGVGAVDYNNDDPVFATKADRTNLGVTYKMGNMYFAGSYEDQDDAANTSYLGLAASFSAGANTFKIGNTSESSDAATDGAATTELEVAHDFSKNTQGFVDYWTQNQEAGDSNALSIGVNMSF